MRKIVLSILAVLLLSFTLSAQNQRVSGTVTDGDRNPMVGVTVVLQGTQVAAVTGLDGQYSITVPSGGILEFSHLGMVTQLVPVAGRTVINVELEADTTVIGDVVVTAYGTTARRDLTGSITTVGSEQLAKQQVTSATKALEGAVPGVQLTSPTNQPGTDSGITVRGVGSIYSGSSALIVLDGSPYNGSMADINPSDIESMSVSKDATANSLYGSRAANGVIFITTKKGRANAPRISFDIRAGINSRAVPEYDLITDPGEYFEAAWRILRDTEWSGQTTKDLTAAGLYASQQLLPSHANYNPFSFSSTYLVDPATGKLDSSAKLKWKERLQDELFQNGLRTDANFSISGGNEKSDYYFSLGYLNDESYVRESAFERYSTRLNLTTQPKSWIKAGANISYVRTITNSLLEGSSLASSPFAVSRGWIPVFPVYAKDADGKTVYEDGKKVYDLGTGQTHGTTTRPGNSGSNIIAELEKNLRENIGNNVNAGGFLDIYFLKDFTFTVNAVVNYRNTALLQFINPEIGEGRTDNGYSRKTYYDFLTRNFNQLLQYKKSFNGHNISALIGHEYYAYTRDYSYMSKKNVYDPTNPHLNNAGEVVSISGYQDNHRMEGYFGKGEYNYNHKYYLSASVRRDGSSRFKYNPWGTFWSVGGAWRFTEESFMDGTRGWLTEGKLRMSYGTQGNEDVRQSGAANYYPYTDRWNVTVNEGVLGTEIAYYGNPNISWEKQNTFDIGIDLSFFDRVSLTVDYFNRISDGLLFRRTKDISSGRPYNWENIGKVRNSGIEFEVTANIISNKDWTWDLSLNGYSYKNKILNLPQEYKESGLPSGHQRLWEGKDMYQYELLRFAGLDEAGKSLWWGLEDDVVNGEVVGQKRVKVSVPSDGEVALLDKSALPDFTGGLSTNLRWKNIDFTIMTSFQLGGWAYDYDYSMFWSSNNLVNRMKDYSNSWNPETLKGTAPILDLNDANGNYASDRFLVSKSYFSIRNISLGYTFPSRWVNSIGISSLRVYFVCDNVLLLSKRKGFDPRQSMGGQGSTVGNYDVNGTYYAPIRTTSLGLSLNF